MSSRVPFLDLRAPYIELKDEIDAALLGVANSGWFLLGGVLDAFEKEFARYTGAKHCVGVANGLDALHLSLLAMGVGDGDEVIVPSNTYIATWLAVSQVGATPVPVEPLLASYNIDPGLIEAAITPRTRAILPVHLYGLPAEMDAIREIASRRNVKLLDDAAQAHGARFGGRRIGSLADASAWSFYPGKNLGAFGDAGAVTTDDDGIAERLRVLRNYGSRVKYVNEVRGFNSRLDEIQAAVLKAKLLRLDEWNARRARLASRYDRALADCGLVLPMNSDRTESCWHLYVVRSKERDELRSSLAARGIDSLIHYPIPPYRQQAYAEFGFAANAFPISNQIHAEVLSLPIGPHFSDADQDRVIDAVLTQRKHSGAAA
jgi:dTDP-4-amino-4,6-dideoxygalactose transaminase